VDTDPNTPKSEATPKTKCIEDVFQRTEDVASMGECKFTVNQWTFDGHQRTSALYWYAFDSANSTDGNGARCYANIATKQVRWTMNRPDGDGGWLNVCRRKTDIVGTIYPTDLTSYGLDAATRYNLNNFRRQTPVNVSRVIGDDHWTTLKKYPPAPNT
jgi:hypothetical protein